MWTIALTILRYVWPYLLGAAILGIGYYKAEHYCNVACTDQKARADHLQELSDAAHKRADDLALLYANNATAADDALRAAQAKASDALAAQQDRVRLLPTLPTLPVSGALVGLLDAATEFANAAPSPSVNQAAAQTISEAALGQYALDAADAYRDAYSHWSACVNFYQGLQNVEIH